MKSPTIPSFAAQVWVEDNSFHVSLPEADGELSHRLTFPCDQQGMIRLRQLLASRHKLSLIGTAGDLTQHQVNKQLKRKVNTDGIPITRITKDKFTPEVKAAAKAVLRRLGL